MRRIAALTVIATMLNLVAAVSPSAGGEPSGSRPTFVRTACPTGTFPPSVDVDCGYVSVPENRAHPHGRYIEVAAAVVHAPAAHPAADPIVFLDGGPSFGAISGFALGEYFAHASYARSHDLILVDTRGTGTSRPNLTCPELDQAEVTAFYEGPAINSHSVPIYKTALHACRDRLLQRGIDLASYDSAESAADLDDLRQALGIRQWNLLAISADGTLGLTYMRRFPGGIRSSIIDSGMSTQMLWELDYSRGLVLELEKVFAGCRANAACNAKYPHIRYRFYRTVHRLQEHPVTIDFPDYRPQPVKLVLDGVGLYYDALTSIYPGDRSNPSQLLDLLDIVWQETHGRLVELYREFLGNGPQVNGHRNAFLSDGKSLSYLCRDSVNFITPADLRQAARDIPPFAPRYLDPNFDLAHGMLIPLSPLGCDVWNVGRAAPVQHLPVTSSIPTLVLAGEYDTGVPPYIVRQVDNRLSHSHYYEFPASAHLQLSWSTTASPCARDIAGQFLADPTATPDSSCIADMPPVDFTPP